MQILVGEMFMQMRIISVSAAYVRVVITKQPNGTGLPIGSDKRPLFSEALRLTETSNKQTAPVTVSGVEIASFIRGWKFENASG